MHFTAFSLECLFLFNNHEQIAGFDSLACFDTDFADDAVDRSGDGGFHLHGFGNNDRVAFLDGGAFFNEEFDDGAGEGCAYFAWNILIGFLGGSACFCDVLVVDLDFARHAVQFELELAVAFCVRFL